MKADATHIFNDYGVKMANTVDLRTLAKSKLVVTSSWTLAGMTACLLGKQLPKDDVRFSRWGSANLSDAQRDYAIKDAVASALVYEMIHKNKDPITCAPSSTLDPDPGSKVSAYELSPAVLGVATQFIARSQYFRKLKQHRNITVCPRPFSLLAHCPSSFAIDAPLQRQPFEVCGGRRSGFQGHRAGCSSALGKHCKANNRETGGQDF